MHKRVVIIQGHPDKDSQHYCHALAAAYMEGARQADIDVKIITVAELDFPVLRKREDWEEGELPVGLRDAQSTLVWAEHLLIIYPLWLGSMPALLKGFFEQVLRPGFAVPKMVDGKFAKAPLQGKSARVVVTMGMPAFFYRLVYRSHSVRSLERNILNFCGVKPVAVSIVGTVESPNARGRENWLQKMTVLGRQGC